MADNFNRTFTNLPAIIPMIESAAKKGARSVSTQIELTAKDVAGLEKLGYTVRIEDDENAVEMWVVKW